VSTPTIHRTRAAIDIDAPAEAVYLALTDLEYWPLLFPWIAHTEVVHRHGADDKAKFWAVRPGPEGGLRIWTSTRTLDSVALRMEFEQQGSVGPISRLGGTWDFLPQEGGGCRVESSHWFTTDADPQDTAAELDRHGALQMRTLKARTENAATEDARALRSESTALLPGTVEEVHALLLAAQPQDGREGDADAWFASSDSEAGRTVQISYAPRTVLRKRLDPPAGTDLYRCRWQLAEAPQGGVLVTAEVLAVAVAEASADDRTRLLGLLAADAQAALAFGLEPAGSR